MFFLHFEVPPLWLHHLLIANQLEVLQGSSDEKLKVVFE